MSNYFTDLNPSKGIPFMDGAEKGEKEEIIGEWLHIEDFGFIEGENGQFAVMKIAERPGKFYFGNSIVTKMLQRVNADSMKKHLKDNAVKFSMKTSAKDRDYMTFEFEEPDGDEIPF